MERYYDIGDGKVVGPEVKIIQLCFNGCSTCQSCVTHNISLYKISKVCIIGTWDFLCVCVCVVVSLLACWVVLNKL